MVVEVTVTDTTRTRAIELDARDPLARFRERFVIDDAENIYLDGNSLGRLPKATRAQLRQAIDAWGRDLVQGWERWIDLPNQAGDVIAGLVGAAPGEVVVSDSTSVNLFKLASAALDARPGRRTIVLDANDFPTDRYILDGLAASRGLRVLGLETSLDDGVDLEHVRTALDEDVALVCLSHVAYRSGAVADLPGITAAAHSVGALTLWDLCHSAGAVPVGLGDARADLAVGCTYKHLNAGPGAPAYLYVRRDLQPLLRQPIQGWFGQREQFAMGPGYQPYDDINRFLVGTPPVLAAYAVLEGARLVSEAGIAAISEKSRALTTFGVDLVDRWLAPHGFRLASPRDPTRRGAHLTLHHPQAWQFCQAMRKAGVIADYRTPERIRLGMPSLYTRFVDVLDALGRLRRIAEQGDHLQHSTASARIT